MRMEARWRGKCRVCGCVIPPRVQIEWTKETGARHVSPEACAEALAKPPLPDPPLREPRDIGAADFEQLQRLLLAQTWKFASTLANIPHWYTLRKNWASDEDFVWVIDALRRSGYQQRFGSLVYLYTDIEQFQYWDCGASGQDESLWIDVMAIDPKRNYFRIAGINRAVRQPAPEPLDV